VKEDFEMDEPLLSPRLQEHLEALVPQRLPEMQRMEAYAQEHDFPIIGPLAGYFCYQISRLIGARKVFELGSGYGYSAAWFAQAVVENGGGVVHHVVWDEGLSRWARKHLDILGFGDVVEYHVSEAIQALENTPGPYDLIFNDINKQDYPNSLPVIAKNLRPGGVLIVDNMLWSGRIFDQNDQSPSTQGIRALTRMITQDPGWITTLVPLHDGLILAFKK
jgi:caffeoyl-CoA O-methyltransferase